MVYLLLLFMLLLCCCFVCVYQALKKRQFHPMDMVLAHEPGIAVCLFFFGQAPISN